MGDDFGNPDQAQNIDQLQLTQEEKDEVITKSLNGKNPQAASNITQFEYKERIWQINELVPQLVIHFSLDGNVILKSSDEATDQEEYWSMKEEEQKKLFNKVNAGIQEEKYAIYRLDGEDQKQEKETSIRNTFNYQARGCQTFNLPLRERGIKTDPPQCSKFSLETTQWQIFDAYLAAKLKVIEEENAEKVAAKGGNKEKKNSQQVSTVKEDPLYSASMKRCLKIMERMIVQNADADKFADYKYYEDRTKDVESKYYGSVLPIWRFCTDKGRKKHVTSICWNPRYKDLFAVGYGSYDFLKETTGLICCYTIKNPTWPEYYFTTESGVMCVDFHQNHPALLSVGLYDGTVMVFDIRTKSNKPIYQSTVRTSKHTDPVWQVAWENEEDPAKSLSFYSISSDGRVTNWSLMKNKLEPEEVMKLKLVLDQDKELVENKKESFLYGLAGGMCFDFNPFHKHLFLVGTEEGKIHLCSKAYSGQYLETYEGHFLAVYSVKWNNYHPRVFLSCSADWTIKMWDSEICRPIIAFDLAYAAGDVQWAPYSSTVFAAVASNGHLYIYDLHQEKHSHLCSHPALKKAKALHVSFNPVDPVILLGDERGGVSLFKLSASLSEGPMQPVDEKTKDDKKDDKPKEPLKTPQELEQEKMDSFLSTQDKEVY